MKDMEKMLGKKPKENNEDKKNAKLGALKELRNSMSEMMQGDLKGRMNKVTVAAPDKESLEQGLDKAKEIVSGEEPVSEEMPESEESEESSEMEEMVDQCESPEEIDKMIQMLQEKKKEMQVK
jgi:hypothetical protein